MAAVSRWQEGANVAELIIRRNEAAWSSWNAAKNMIDLALERTNQPRGRLYWTETEQELTFVGSEQECEAITVALEGLGLDVIHPPTGLLR
jgi:hypothetical protein